MKVSSRKLKVLHIIQGFSYGGAETWLLRVARYFASHEQLNIQNDFLVAGGEKAFLDDEVIKAGSKIFYLKYSLNEFFVFRKGLKKILKEGGYDVIHDHQDFVSGWHFLAALGNLPPVRISHLHNPYNFVNIYRDSLSRDFSYFLGRCLMVLLATKVTGTSDNVMDEYGYNLWPFNLKRVKPAYCGFDADKFKLDECARTTVREELGISEKNKICLFIGRIGLGENEKGQNQKNPEFAFQVAKELVRTSEDWNVLFVGYKGSVGEKMETEILDSGLGKRIQFLSQRNDVPRLMSAANVMMFPSIWEGLGMVVVEAQANGLPVIASETLPSEAVVIEQLVDLKPLDKVDQWVEAILETERDFGKSEVFLQSIKDSPFSIRNSCEYLRRLYLKPLE
jgi:glycosyltransferase involved in cell wall biosynthesis